MALLFFALTLVFPLEYPTRCLQDASLRGFAQSLAGNEARMRDPLTEQVVERGSD